MKFLRKNWGKIFYLFFFVGMIFFLYQKEMEARQFRNSINAQCHPSVAVGTVQHKNRIVIVCAQAEDYSLKIVNEN